MLFLFKSGWVWMKTMFVYRQDTETTPPRPPRDEPLYLVWNARHRANTYEVQDRTKVALKRCSFPRWQPGTLRFWGRWGSRHLGMSSGVRMPAGAPTRASRGSPHSSAEAALPDAAERTHEPAPPRSAWDGTRTPFRHLTSPLGAERRPAEPSSPSPLRGPRRGAARPGCSDSSAALPAPNPSPTGSPSTKPAANSSCAKPNLPAGKQGLSSHLRTPATSCLLIGWSGSANRLRPFWLCGRLGNSRVCLGSSARRRLCFCLFFSLSFLTVFLLWHIRV